jgi:2-dehydropantoate 2-reductase
MKKIVVLGVGAIGALVGGRLALGGQDVTLVCTNWRANVEHLKTHGLTIAGPDGMEETTPVKALFIDELAQLPGTIDILLIATKSNDTERCLTAAAPFLAADAMVVSLQNGVNEEVIIPIVGEAAVVACVSYAGGGLLRPGYVRAHGGRFVVGELDGRITPRARELADILSLVAPAECSADVMAQRWDKLAQVTMTVPVGAIAGVGFPAILHIEKAHAVFGKVMSETLAVAAAAGHPLDDVVGLTRADWARLAQGPVPELSRIISAPFAPRPGVPAPVFNPDEAPLLKDLKLGLPLEIDFTNGYVIRKGRELGVPTPTHDLLMAMLERIVRGEIEPGLGQLDELVRAGTGLT